MAREASPLAQSRSSRPGLRGRQMKLSDCSVSRSVLTSSTRHRCVFAWKQNRQSKSQDHNNNRKPQNMHRTQNTERITLYFYSMPTNTIRRVDVERGCRIVVKNVQSSHVAASARNVYVAEDSSGQFHSICERKITSHLHRVFFYEGRGMFISRDV